MAYIDLDVNVTPKVHAVIWHVPQFCARFNEGLGRCSEQAGESVHHDFAKTWENYKLKSLSHPEYGNSLKRAVCAYNGRHLVNL